MEHEKDGPLPAPEGRDASARETQEELLRAQEELEAKKQELDRVEAELAEKKKGLTLVKECLYDKINVSLKTMNIVIVILVVLIAALLAYGIFSGRGIGG